MYKGRSILGLVPARGGSKGLRDKNTLPLCGKPLICWTISEALKSKYLDAVCVSTDSPGIAETARKCGAEVPFMRPRHLATDTADGDDVALHALRRLAKDGRSFDIIVYLQPTSPLRTVLDIDLSIDLLFKKSAGAIVSVCEAEHHPLWANTLPPDGSMKNFLRREIKKVNRQQLPAYYRLNGAIYISGSDQFIEHGDFIRKDTFAYLMPQERSVDVDSELDFRVAEIIIKKSRVRP